MNPRKSNTLFGSLEPADGATRHMHILRSDRLCRGVWRDADIAHNIPWWRLQGAAHTALFAPLGRSALRRISSAHRRHLPSSRADIHNVSCWKDIPCHQWAYAGTRGNSAAPSWRTDLSAKQG